MSVKLYLIIAAVTIIISAIIGLYGTYYTRKKTKEDTTISPTEQKGVWEIDVLGREVDSVITYTDFINRYVENKNNERNCSNFTQDGFSFYECGAWGLGDLRIGFKTKEDLKKYRKWLSDKKCELEG